MQAYQSFRVPYASLDAATLGFGTACCIGGGASCAVYKAQVYGTWVAVKPLNLRSDDESKIAKSEARQFAADMTLLTTVQHPNICRLLGVSTDGDRQCLVLEYCLGGALDKRLKRDRDLLASGQAAALGWKQRLQIAVGIARALEHLHSLTPAMIHRDVKTQNVLLAQERCTDWVANTKVSDFGTVREGVRERKWMPKWRPT
jgi:serine/threonine protein kinase